MNKIFCKYLKKESLALKQQPLPGDIGAKILANTSKEAWQLWLKEQVKLINENKLNLTEQKTKDFLLEKMHDFLNLN